MCCAFQGGFDAPTAQIVEGHIGHQNRDRISDLRTDVPQHRKHLLGRQRADQDAIGEGPVLSATAHGNALNRAHSGLAMRTSQNKHLCCKRSI